MPTDNIADLLADLRDYHMPPGAWWSLAPVWWVLIVCLAIVVSIGITWWLRRWRRKAAARYAHAELAALRVALAKQGDSASCLRALSKLLRRFALTCFPSTQVAGLTGTAWLQFLDAHGGRGQFQSHPGKLLVSAQYQQQQTDYCLELMALVESWVNYRESR